MVSNRIESAEVKVIPRWSEVYGGSQSPVKERPQELVRKAQPSYLGPVVLKAPPSRVKMRPPSSPLSTHDSGVDLLSRRYKKALIELHEEAGLDVLKNLLRDQRWSKHQR